MSEKKAKGKRKISKEEALAQLWEMGELSWLLTDVQKKMKHGVDTDSTRTSVIVCSRRLGKCIAEGTLVHTTKGIKAIENLTTEDMVYGYNSDGTVTPTKVMAKQFQGHKEVVDLVHNGAVLATCTEDHRWGTYDTYSKKESVKRVKNFNSRTKIRREFVKSECGDVNEPHAYAIGALLGDGCSREKGMNKYISSNDPDLVKKVANTLGAKYYDKQHKNNYTWRISNNEKKYSHSDRGSCKGTTVHCNYYNEWLKGKYAHEKIIDLEVIKKWNRVSLLELLAGLIDSDGSVFVTKDNCLKTTFTSQSKSMIQAYRFIILQLFSIQTKISVDARDKYVNGECYSVNIKNNLYSKEILRELSPYLTCERKKYKKEYDNLLENNTNKDYVGVKVKNKRKVNTWDITVNNDTHLYVLANGLITHNTFLMVTLALEQSLKHPNSITKFLLPKQKDAKTIIQPIMREVTETCPEKFRPEYNTQDKIYRFYNGSEIHLGGSDLSAESLRGTKAHLVLIDEAGFVNDLLYSIRSILSPTIRTTRGRMILASTPSRDPQHEFVQYFMNPYKAQGRLEIYDIYQNPNFTPEIIQEIIDEYPRGVEDPDFRREYLCEVMVDEEKTICPEFSANKKDIVYSEGEVEDPDYKDYYVSMDIGHKDLTIALFCYYDFKKAQVVIMDELVMNGPTMTTDKLAEGLRLKEELRFYCKKKQYVLDPYVRVMDVSLGMQQDLSIMHDIQFMTTRKDNKEGAINEMRMWVGTGRVKIHERCEHLLYHLEYGQWNDRRTDFKRLPDTPDKLVKGGHVDGIPALYYLIRNIQTSKNPFPRHHGLAITKDTFMSPKFDMNASQAGDLMRKMLNIKKRK